jgi:hypothetical protein
LWLLTSCKKEDGLPKSTSKGANTFGCKIGGQLFFPESSGNFGSLPPLLTYFNDSSKHFTISVSEDRDNSNNGYQRYFRLEVKHLVIGSNVLNDLNTGKVSISEYNTIGKTFITTQAVGGTLNIKRLDTVARIISGTFDFKAAIQPTNTPGEIIHVTEGRFDITYN